MAGSSFVALGTCAPSFSDNSYLQLQHMASPEATAACLAPPQQGRRHSRPRLSVVNATAKPLLGNCIDKEEFSHCGCKPCPSIDVTCTGTPLLDRCKGAFVLQNLHGFPKRKKHMRIFIICNTAKPMLDRRSNDADDAVSSTESQWREEVSSSLQRSLLESQWALQSAQSCLCQDESSSVENFTLSSTNESTSFHVHSQQLGSSVVRSGQASARRRRLMARTRADVMGRHNGIESSKALNISIPTKLSGKKKNGKFKLDPLQEFVSSFLKATSGSELLTKDQEKGFTKQMRVCQSLEKAKHELQKKLGYDPPYELWAQSVNMSTKELLIMVREGEVARNKMVSSHLRLVVSVARAYQNLGVDTADLVLEGSKGLLRGLKKFDHRKGYKMSTYAHWWIRQGITRAISCHSRLVRVPNYLHEIMYAIRGAKESLYNRGKPVTVENISSLLKVPTYLIRRALRAKSKVSSLDKSDSSFGLKMEFNGLHEFVADSTGENDPWKLCNKEDTIDKARDRLTVLTSREQDIIRWVFGIDTEGGAQSSCTSIAVKLGVSKERVRQIKCRALCKMRLEESNDNVASLVDDL